MSIQPYAPPPLSPDLQKAFAKGWEHQQRCEWDAAAAAYQKVLRKVPDHADIIHLLAMVRGNQGKVDEALSLYGAAAKRKPADAKIWYNMALLLGGAERNAEAAEAMCNAMAQPSAPPATAAMLLHYRRASADWRDYGELCQRVATDCVSGHHAPPPFFALWMDDPALQKLAGESEIRRRGLDRLPARPAMRRADGRLRIGYVGADFRAHPSARLMARVFERHDRAAVEVIAFSIGVNDGSPERKRIEAAVDQFHDVATLPSPDVVARIRACRVDILVDLMGHTTGARLDVFAARPAPLQVAMLGFPGTSGAAFIDYLIADPVVAPLEMAPHFTEKLALLPETYYPNDDLFPIDAPPTREEAGLPGDGVVFGSFNLLAKLTPQMFGAWMRILQNVPGSVLWMMAAEEARDNLRTAAASHGVDPGRLVFAPRVAAAAHLARLALVDVALDSFPYTGHTTTTDMMRLGVPVVTRMGHTFASRVAAGLLRCSGLPDLVAEDRAAYEALGIRLGRDPAFLGHMRNRVAAARDDGPVFHTERYTRHLEAAYRLMAEGLATGRSPDHFMVAAK